MMRAKKNGQNLNYDQSNLFAVRPNGHRVLFIVINAYDSYGFHFWYFHSCDICLRRVYNLRSYQEC